MFPLKRFIQGPSLHDEQISYTEESNVGSNASQLSGQEASKIYEEIINLPSSSASHHTNEIRQSTRKSSRGKVNSSVTSVVKQETIKGPVPKLSRLMSLCESNNSSSLKEALEEFYADIDINAKDEFGWTMLMSASCAGAFSCVSLLLQYGASWEIKDKKGLTALSLASKNRHEEVCNLLQEWNECYIELCQRKFESESEESHQQSIEDDSNATPSETYCAACKIQYSSSKGEHENSIAHLVCTAQFGEDRAHYGIPESNKGFQLMVKSGWDRNRGLGPEGKGHKFPVKTVLKRNKLGLGNEKEKKLARVTHFAPFDPAAVETQTERREREETIRKREAVRLRNKERRKEINFRRELSSL